MLGIVPVLQPSRTHNPHLLRQGEEGWHPASGAGAPCPAVAPLRAQGKALDVHRCSLSLGVISEVLHHPFVFDKVKCWAGGGAGQQGSARTARRDSSTFATTHSSDTFPRAKFYFSIPFAESQL